MSHEEDADGISSAALIKQAFGGETILADYPGMMDAMEPLRDDKKLKEFYICDLGLNSKNENDFKQRLRKSMHTSNRGCTKKGSFWGPKTDLSQS